MDSKSWWKGTFFVVLVGKESVSHYVGVATYYDMFWRVKLDMAIHGRTYPNLNDLIVTLDPKYDLWLCCNDKFKKIKPKDKMVDKADLVQEYRDWQVSNQEYTLACDIPNIESMYVQWEELDDEDKDYWRKIYGIDAPKMYGKNSRKKCKYTELILTPYLELRLPSQPQPGFCMTVYKTKE